MSLFRKPKIQVLKVQTERRQIEESSHYYSTMAGSSGDNEKTTKNVSYTIVLLTRNGELMTREFNGNWGLADIKKWEDL